MFNLFCFQQLFGWVLQAHIDKWLSRKSAKLLSLVRIQLCARNPFDRTPGVASDIGTVTIGERPDQPN